MIRLRNRRTQMTHAYGTYNAVSKGRAAETSILSARSSGSPTVRVVCTFHASPLGCGPCAGAMGLLYHQPLRIERHAEPPPPPHTHTHSLCVGAGLCLMSLLLPSDLRGRRAREQQSRWSSLPSTTPGFSGFCLCWPRRFWSFCRCRPCRFWSFCRRPLGFWRFCPCGL